MTTQKIGKQLHNKTKKKYNNGGVRILETYNAQDAIKYFLQYSSFSYFSRGYHGILVLAKLRNGIKSPYAHVRTNYSGEVRELLIKLYNLTESNDPTVVSFTSDRIREETSIQIELYHKSIRYDMTLCEPICPCIVYSNPNKLSVESKQQLIKHMFRTMSDKDKRIIENSLINDVAFIAMEFMHGAIKLSDLEESSDYQKYKLMGLHALHNMHKHGFMHEDYNNDNVLILPDYIYYGENEKGRAIIIDFGLSCKTDDTRYLRMLKKDSFTTCDENILIKFSELNREHDIIQEQFVKFMENKHRTKILDIINSYQIYIGGNMNQTNIKETKNNNVKKQIEMEKKQLKKTGKKYDFSPINETYDEFRKRNKEINKERDGIIAKALLAHYGWMDKSTFLDGRSDDFLTELAHGQMNGLRNPEWKCDKKYSVSNGDSIEFTAEDFAE